MLRSVRQEILLISQLKNTFITTCGEENGYRVHLYYVEMLGFVFNVILTY